MSTEKERHQITVSMVKSALTSEPGKELLRYLEVICNGRGTTEMTPFDQGKRAVYWKLRNLLDLEEGVGNGLA